MFAIRSDVQHALFGEVTFVRYSWSVLLVLAGCASKPAAIPIAIPPSGEGAFLVPVASKRGERPTRVLPWQDDERAAMELAKRDGLPILVYVRADWSAEALRVEREIWSDAAVTRALDGVVLIRLDVTNDTEMDRAFAWGVRDIPGVVLVSQDGSRATMSPSIERDDLLVGLRGLRGQR